MTGDGSTVTHKRFIEGFNLQRFGEVSGTDGTRFGVGSGVGDGELNVGGVAKVGGELDFGVPAFGGFFLEFPKDFNGTLSRRVLVDERHHLGRLEGFGRVSGDRGIFNENLGRGVLASESANKR